LNILEVNEIRQIEMHTAELLVHDPTSYEAGIAVEKKI
jgi:hypothetical protein